MYIIDNGKLPSRCRGWREKEREREREKEGEREKGEMDREKEREYNLIDVVSGWTPIFPS
jgi:hypothetical protein